MVTTDKAKNPRVPDGSGSSRSLGHSAGQPSTNEPNGSVEGGSVEGGENAEKVQWAKDLGEGVGGYEMVFPAVILSLGGLWIDNRLGWTPILTIVFAVLGIIGGTLAVYYRYKRDIERLESETAALRAEARRQRKDRR